MNTAVIGGGWAGLAAAVTLASRNVPVTLYESSRQLGGRARCVPWNGLSVDNGQHLMIGAYTRLLALLRTLNIDEQKAFLRQRVSLHMHAPGQDTFVLSGNPLPAPLNLVYSLLTLRGASWRDKRRALGLCLYLARQRFRLAQDVSVHALLIRHRQTPTLIRRLWEPLCLATLNTPLSEASAQAFLIVLRDAFSRRNHYSDLLIPRQGLSEILPLPAMEYIEQRQGHIRLRQRVRRLEISGKQAKRLWCDEEDMAHDQFILALPPYATARLLRDHTPLAPLCASLSDLPYQPITTIWFRYPNPVDLPQPMIGMTQGVSQWLFDRRVCGQPNVLSVVISARGPHSDWPTDKLVQQVMSEIAIVSPALAEPEDHYVITEKRATFSCDIASQDWRPDNVTAIENLWLAGDYTRTGYPATLEGAIISGVRAAEFALARR